MEFCHRYGLPERIEDTAAMKKARTTAGPEPDLPTSPERTQTPAPSVDPTPRAVKSTTVKTRANAGLLSSLLYGTIWNYYMGICGTWRNSW